MSRNKKLLILLTVLVLCVGIYFIADRFLSEEALSGGNIEITSVDSGKITSIKWDFEGNQCEIKKGDDNSWYYADDESFPLDQDIAVDMLSAVSSVKAVKEVTDDPSDLSTYGIDDPQIKLYVTADGQEHEYDIGDYNESSGYYYMMHTGDASLYYVDSSLYDLFSLELLDLAEKEYLPEIETEDVSKITIASGGKEIEINYYADGKEGFDSQYKYFVTDDSGNQSPCDESTVKSLITGFTNISWSSCQAYNVTEDDLALYGLNSPAAAFSIEYTYTVESETASGEEQSDNKVTGRDTLLIGNSFASQEDGENYYYAMIQGGKCVYALSASSGEAYIISGAEELLSKELMSFDEDDIQEMTVTYKGEQYKITAEEKETTDEYGDETTETVYYLNSAEIDLSSFVTSLSELKASSVQQTEIGNKGDLLISVKNTYKDGTQESIYIYSYDDDYCAAGVGGEVKYFADESECDELYVMFKEALKAVEVTTV